MSQPEQAVTATATIEQFFTRQRANEGVDLPLFLPDGKPTTHSIKIRGADSDAFRLAEAESKRRLMQLSIDGDRDKLVASLATERIDLLASLVISWTFADRPCTLENVKTVLREAPQIADQIDKLSSKRQLFFALSSTNSGPSPAQSSS